MDTAPPRENRAPPCPHVPGFEVQSRPQPQSRRPPGAHKGGYQHATFTGVSSARARPRMPPLGRRARKILAGMPPKKHSLGRCARKLWQRWNRKPLQGCLPKNSLGRRARKLWGPALEQEALAGMPPKKLSRTLR